MNNYDSERGSVPRVACMSALEPLASQDGLDATVQAFVREAQTCLSSVVGKEHEHFNALRSRLGQLGKESINASIQRLVTKTLGNPEEGEKMRTWYGIRSKIVHGDSLDPEVDLLDGVDYISAIVVALIEAA